MSRLIHLDRIFLKKLLENKETVFKNVKNVKHLLGRSEYILKIKVPVRLQHQINVVLKGHKDQCLGHQYSNFRLRLRNPVFETSTDF